MFRVEVTTDIRRFRDQLKTYQNRAVPIERRCLQNKMADSAREAAINHAVDVTSVGRAQIKKIVQIEKSKKQLRANGQFTGAFRTIRIDRDPRNRTSQVLILMATGGTVDIPSDEMGTMTINFKYSVRKIRQIVARTISQTKPVTSAGGIQTWYGINSGRTN